MGQMRRGDSLRPGAALGVAAIALATTLLLFSLLGCAYSRLWIVDPASQTLLGYLAVWVPLVTAALVASSRFGSGSIVRDYRLRFRPIDLLWGLGIGLLARMAAAIVEIAVYGRIPSSAVQLGTPVFDAWWFFAALLAPVILAPLIEEVFFRGLLLRSLLGLGTPGMRSTVVAILVSSAVFALVHVTQATSAPDAVAAGVATIIFAIASAIATMATGRLGAGIVAHVTFNALIVVPALI